MRFICAGDNNATDALSDLRGGSPFDDLPDEVVLAILGALAKDVVALLQWSATCKRHRELAMDVSVWQQLCGTTFGPLLHLQFLGVGKDWLWLYKAQACRVVKTARRGPWVGAILLAGMYRGAKVYWGDLVDGRPDGYGLALTMPGKDWLKPERTIEDASVQPTSRYEGYWKAGKMHGYGREVDFDGDIYEGDWEAGVKSGRGRYVCASDGSVFEGDWRGDKLHGHATLMYGDGDRYDGQCLNGRKHGRGVYVWATGDVYRGDWRNGQRHGCGSMIRTNGDRYDGHWREGKRNGYGELVTAGGDLHHRGVYHRIDRHFDALVAAGNAACARTQHPPAQGGEAAEETAVDGGGSSYCGWWVDDAMTGHGVCRWSDGAEYVGMFKNDAVCGYGAYACAGGERVAATWDGSNIVHAVVTRPDGFRYEGLWDKARGSVGRGSCAYPDGSRIVGTWDGDKALQGEMITHRTIGLPCSPSAPCMACDVMAGAAATSSPQDAHDAFTPNAQ